MNGQPDSARRVLIATIALIVILAWVTGGHAAITGQPFPVSR